MLNFWNFTKTLEILLKIVNFIVELRIVKFTDNLPKNHKFAKFSSRIIIHHNY